MLRKFLLLAGVLIICNGQPLLAQSDLENILVGKEEVKSSEKRSAISRKKSSGTSDGDVVDSNAGSGEVVSSQKSLETLKAEAEKSKNPVLCYKIARMYQNGDVTGSVEERIAADWFEKAAKKGHVASMLELGLYYKSIRQQSRARSWLIKAADKRNGRALFELGVMYEYGTGVFQSYKKALRYYQNASKSGELSAHMKLAKFYKDGIGTKPDIKKAVRHLLILKDKTTDPEMKDEISARLAAISRLIALESQDPETRFKWLRSAAKGGDIASVLDIAYMYQNGIGVEQDYEQAIFWYNKAVGRGSVSAMTNLGYIYANGFGVSVDYPTAFHWYKEAAELGDSDAAWNLGNFYMSGLGTDRDVAEAKKWFERSEALKRRHDAKKK